MEVEEIQGQGCNKFQRIGNGRNSSGEIGPEEEEVDGELRRFSGGGGGDGVENRLRGWHNSSRIIRVSRASGGKDRHSKVWTSKGLRDRRVRLSVTTAIQFYDLQDRLGYDQPSKAVEWLIKAAADAISELPELNSSFPETPRQLSDEKRFDSAEMELDYNNNNQNQVSLSKSSSTSETSKGSGLSLSRSEVRVNRVKASRERARERAMKDKDKDQNQNQNPNPISHNSSFTELLTGGGSNTATSPTAGETNLYHKAPRQWSAGPPMDYFSPGLLGQSSSSRMQAFHLGNSIPVSPYNVAVAGDVHGHGHHPELQQFSFVHDHFIPVVSQQPGSGGSSDYNLNFTISSSGAGSLAGGGYNSRGTLQSNSPSFLPHLQRFASPIDGSNVPFFLGTSAPVENHHHQHIFYGDRLHSDHKEKGKN